MMKKKFTLDEFLGKENRIIEQRERSGMISEHSKEWKWIRLEKVVCIRKETINPQDYPEEEFELYSIPAYHANGKPEIKPGKK